MGLAVTVTRVVRVTLVLVMGSKAVTWRLAVCPAAAWVVSMWTTPLGLVLLRTVEVKTIGLAGRVGSAVLFITRVIRARVSAPATSWPKIVWLKSRNRGEPVVMKNW